MISQVTNEQLMLEIADLKKMMLKLLQSAPVKMEVISSKDPAEIALQMARAGDHEGSKRYLKSLSSRRAA